VDHASVLPKRIAYPDIPKGIGIFLALVGIPVLKDKVKLANWSGQRQPDPARLESAA
jgi:hypothetical protein